MGLPTCFEKAFPMMSPRLLSCVLVLSCAGWGCSRSPEPSNLPTLSVTPVRPQASPTVSPASLAAAKLMEQGRLSAALAEATRGVIEAPQNVQAYETRAAIQHKLGNWEAALEDFSQAIALDPQNARLLNNRGYLWLSREKFSEALADFDAAIAAAPEHANAHNNRGLLQIAQGRHRQAVLDFDRAIQISPNYVDARNNRGFALMQLGRWDRALADLNRALELDTKNVNALANRGFVKQNLGDIAGAILDFTSAMMLDPDNPKYYLHRHDAYLLEGAYAQAQQDLAQVEKLRKLQLLSYEVTSHPEDASKRVARGRFLRQAGHPMRALEDFSQAVKLSTHSTLARLERAQLLVEMGDFKAAIEDCDAILASDSDQRAYSIRGDCRLKLDDIDGAVADFEAAKRLDDRVAEAFFQKSQTLAKRGDTAAAEEFRARAIAIDPALESRQ